MTPKELCMSLVQAKSEEEVSNIINTNEILKDERNWASYGDLDSNVGTFLNQQSHPVAALSEKIVNSIDALLLAECKKRGINPESAKAPRSMQEAVEEFFGIKEGDFSDVAWKKRRSIAENIMIIAEGERKRPNIIIADKGEGQNPKDFEDTFLSLHKRNKISVPFVQGKFNMGSTGALPFCGNKHYQLILSRKHPDLLTGARKDYWGFTLVRYREARGYEKSGIFEYSVDNTGDILKFEGAPLSIFPENRVLEYGTFIKMYEYRLERPSLIHREFWKDLNRALFSPAIPVLLYEARDFEGMHTKDRLLLGNRLRLKVDERDLLEETMSIEALLGDFGMCRIEVFILSDSLPEDKKLKKDEFSTQNDAVFFTINGQTHTTFGRSFLKSERKAGLDYLADSMVIHVDLSNIPSRVRDHAFMGSRDRMRDDEIKRNVEEALAEVLRKHEGLRKLNQVRRERAITSNPKDEQFLKKLLQQLVKFNSSIAEILGMGSDIKHSEPGPVEISKFIGKRFPTYLKIENFNSKEKLFCKTVPANSYVIVKLETDAENAYLDRDKERGELIVSPSEVRQSSHLYNGIITLRLIPKEDWKIGQKHRVTVELTRCYDAPLTVDLDIIVGEEKPPEQNEARHHDTTKGRALKLPKPTLVYKYENVADDVRCWNQMTPVWTGKDIADLKVTRFSEGDDEKQYDVYINMDSDDLHNFLRRKKLSQNEQDFVKRLYQTSILLYSLVLYNDLSKINGGKEEMLPEIMKTISKVCLDLAYSESLVKAVEEY